MNEKEKAIKCFKKLVKYAEIDIPKLLEIEGIAGQIAHCVNNGIDWLGCIVYGGISKERYKKIIVEYFLDDYPYKNDKIELSKFIYEYIRCGFTHEGFSKGNIEPVRSNDNKLLIKGDKIKFNVDEFARRYLKVLYLIKEEVKYLPPKPDPNNEVKLSSVKEIISRKKDFFSSNYSYQNSTTPYSI
ncbi:MAG: hypothetical protein AABY32_02570 [Nanoarchaeota archaeon]